MIELTLPRDTPPAVDPAAYAHTAMKAAEGFGHAPGLLELRAQQSLRGSPQVRMRGPSPLLPAPAITGH